MAGEQLHQFDVQLCQYALANVQAYMGDPAFAAYVERQIDSPLLAYLGALASEADPETLLLADLDLADLAETFAGGPLEHDRPWVPHERLHRDSINCAREIRDELAREYAGEWARASARFTKHLERDGTHLGDGIETVHEWIRKARRLLRALGTLALLPYPEGSFPTPSCPDPPPMPSPPAAPRSADSQRNDPTLLATITEMRDLLVSQRTVKDFYTTIEVAKILGKSDFTVREWCRKGRAHGQKQGSGRGKHQAWVMSHDELQRLQRDGLLPKASK